MREKGIIRVAAASVIVVILTGCQASIHKSAVQTHPPTTRSGQSTATIQGSQGRTPVPVTTSSAGTSASGTPTSAGQAQNVRYLDDLSPVSGTVFGGSLTMSGTSYPHGALIYCGTSANSATYNVAGAQVFSATVGIPDNENATGDTVDVSFYDENHNQLGKTVSVSLGHPVKVTVNLNSAVQLEIRCIAAAGITDGGTLGVGFGNPAVK